eukprot:612394-Lingulodinium_polyedra.AAC.1
MYVQDGAAIIAETKLPSATAERLTRFQLFCSTLLVASEKLGDARAGSVETVFGHPDRQCC